MVRAPSLRYVSHGFKDLSTNWSAYNQLGFLAFYVFLNVSFTLIGMPES